MDYSSWKVFYKNKEILNYMSSAYQKNSISTKGAEIGTLKITHANAKSLSEEFLGNETSTTIITVYSRKPFYEDIARLS